MSTHESTESAVEHTTGNPEATRNRRMLLNAWLTPLALAVWAPVAWAATTQAINEAEARAAATGDDASMAGLAYLGVILAVLIVGPILLATALGATFSARRESLTTIGATLAACFGGLFIYWGATASSTLLVAGSVVMFVPLAVAVWSTSGGPAAKPEAAVVVGKGREASDGTDRV